jgi:hypothetical protein
VGRDIAEDCRWTWGNGAVRTLTVTIVTFNVTFGAAWSILVLYATQRLGLGPVRFGLLTTVGALGGIAGTAAHDWLQRHVTLADIMRVGLLIETFSHFGFALTTSAWVAMAIMFVFGAHAFIWGTTSQTCACARYRWCCRAGWAASTRSASSAGSCSAKGWAASSCGPGHHGALWFAFVGSGLLVAAIWRQLTHIALADEEALDPA